MNPNLWKILTCPTGSILQAPADDLGGGGADDGESDDVETDDGEDDDGEEADDDETEDGEEADDDETEDGESDEEEDEDDEDLGTRARKRIGKLVKERNSANAEVKRLKGELENAQRLSGDDGRAILAAATRTGILPGLMTKDEAQAFESIERYPKVIETYQDWLDEHGPDDEFGYGDDAMTYGAVKKRVRRLSAELEQLRDEYGDRQKDLRKKVRKIFELGMKAYRKGDEVDGEGENPKGKKPKGKQKPSVPPHGRKPIAKGGKSKAKWGEVTDSDSFARMIASQQKGD